MSMKYVCWCGENVRLSIKRFRWYQYQCDCGQRVEVYRTAVGHLIRKVPIPERKLLHILCTVCLEPIRYPNEGKLLDRDVITCPNCRQQSKVTDELKEHIRYTTTVNDH